MNEYVGKHYNAVLFGGTGGVGAHLLRKLLASYLCDKVTVISRIKLPKHPKLKVETGSISQKFYLENKIRPPIFLKIMM